MFFVYMLHSEKDNNLYTGYTNDIQRRIAEHNGGKVESTKNRRPLKLIYYEAHLSEEDAQRREDYFKTSKGKATLRQMLRQSLKENYCLQH